jgi:hypothetical protein
MLNNKILQLCYFSFKQLVARIKGEQKEGRGRVWQRRGEMRVEGNVAGEQEGNKCRMLGTFHI